MKVWMYQRLWKIIGDTDVYAEYYLTEQSDSPIKDEFGLAASTTDDDMFEWGFMWLCPKPNLVLVDRKYL